MEITDRLENLKAKSLSLRHSEVVDSFSKAVRKWGRLTPRQESFLGSIEAQYDEEAIAERQEKMRRVQEDEEYRKDVEIVCRYYIMCRHTYMSTTFTCFKISLWLNLSTTLA